MDNSPSLCPIRFSREPPGRFTWDPGNLADAAGETKEHHRHRCRPGDAVFVAAHTTFRTY
jgi:hypothetical protein